jgi:Na+-transporting NADH:ubiquinone oxidoreductase subunit NqrE
MTELLLWALSCVLFLLAVACAVLAAVVNRRERPYLFWAAGVAWIVLILAVALVVSITLR